MIRIRRIYEAAEAEDGARLLVDRLWPRGLRKSEGALLRWARELAPSDLLRRRLHGGRIDRDTFRMEYWQELEAAPWQETVALSVRENVTLLTATRDVEQSHLQVLRDFLKQKLRTGGSIPDRRDGGEAKAGES